MEYLKVSLKDLRPNQRNARRHPKKQLRSMARSIDATRYFNPIVIDETNLILAGHGRFEAAKLLQLKEVPVIRMVGLSEPRKRALALADNRIAEGAGWDRKVLALEFPELIELLHAEDLEIGITGFEPSEVDQIVIDFETATSDHDDELDPAWDSGRVVSRRDDLWQLGDNFLLCGDARNATDVNRLVGQHQVDMVFTDPPFDLQIQSVVDRANPAEFATTSGETSDPAFRAFLKSTLGLAASVSRPGGLSFVGVDWRRVADLIEVGREVFDWMVDLVVWTKPSSGQGSFYRSQHRLIGVFRVGDAQLNPIPLGRPGRSRSNVWRYAGSNVLVADAVRDCTRRGDLVFDPVSGSGTTILAAERVGRRAFAIELEPRLVDVGIRRWQQFSKRDAIHTKSGQTFDERSEQAVGGQS